MGKVLIGDEAFIGFITLVSFTSILATVVIENSKALVVIATFKNKVFFSKGFLNIVSRLVCKGS